MKLLAAVGSLLSLLSAGIAHGADPVGSGSCGACHPQAYASWSAGPHARAAESLTQAERAQPSCTYCHAPELARASETVGQREGQGSAPGKEAGVTCESCHGAGQYYSPNYVMKDAELARAVGLIDPGSKSCLVCHTSDSPSLTPFDYAARVKLIDHWSSGGSGRVQHRAASKAGTEVGVSESSRGGSGEGHP